jgi:hypothetical protein
VFTDSLARAALWTDTNTETNTNTIPIQSRESTARLVSKTIRSRGLNSGTWMAITPEGPSETGAADTAARLGDVPRIRLNAVRRRGDPVSIDATTAAAADPRA